MTSITRISLGTSHKSGKHAVDSCLAFKTAIRQAIGREADCCWLSIRPDNDRLTCSIDVCYDSDEPVGEAWAKQAKSIAPRIWQQIEQRRKPVLCV